MQVRWECQLFTLPHVDAVSSFLSWITDLTCISSLFDFLWSPFLHPRRILIPHVLPCTIIYCTIEHPPGNFCSGSILHVLVLYFHDTFILIGFFNGFFNQYTPELGSRCGHSKSRLRHTSRDGKSRSRAYATRPVMLSSLRPYTLNAVRALRSARRYSTPVDAVPIVGEPSGAPGALRPHLNIPVNPNHGLYAFFRKREKDGKVIHDSLEDHSGLQDVYGKVTACPSFRVG